MNTENRFVRRMQPEDIQEITAIYAHYVKETTVTFDLIPPSVTEMTITLKPIINSYPAWVCCSHNQIIGYAYAHPWKSKAAYATTLETTLYIHPNYTRQGLGQLLLSKLISDAQQKQIHALIACITYPNLPSEKLHEKFGFMKVSHFSEVGKKFGCLKKTPYFCTRNSGCSSARLEYASGGRVVAGSNPVTPTGKKEGVKSLA